MLHDMEQTSPLFKPTSYWERQVPAILEDIALYGIENFQAHPSAHHLYAGATSRKKAERDIKLLPSSYWFRQSSYGCPGPLYETEGQRYSFTALNYLRGLVFLDQYVDPKSVKKVLEIGGGFGSFGEIVQQLRPWQFYVGIDIPPVAAVATHYLQQVYQGAVLDYSESRHMEILDLDALANRYRAVVLCPWQLPKLVGQVSLGVNFLSFQEMEPDVVANYAAHLTRLGTQHLLLRNSRHGKPGTAHPVTTDLYCSLFDKFQLVAKDSERFGDEVNGLISEVLIFKCVL